jgi:hypothetical protein
MVATIPTEELSDISRYPEQVRFLYSGSEMTNPLDVWVRISSFMHLHSARARAPFTDLLLKRVNF